MTKKAMNFRRILMGFIPIFFALAPLFAQGLDPYVGSVAEGANLYKKGDFLKAAEAYQKALSFKPKSGEAYYFLGNSYYRAGKFAEAIEAHLKAEQNKFRSWDLYLNLGASYYTLERYPEAISAYKKGIKLKPKQESLYINIALAYAKLNDEANMIASMKKAAEYGNIQAKNWLIEQKIK